MKTMLFFQQLLCSLHIYIRHYPNYNKMIDKSREDLCNFKGVFPFNINNSRVRKLISCHPTSMQKLFSPGIQAQRVNPVDQARFFIKAIGVIKFTNMIDEEFQGDSKQCACGPRRNINNFLRFFKELLGFWRHFFLRREPFRDGPNDSVFVPQNWSTALNTLCYTEKVDVVAPSHIFQSNLLVVVGIPASCIARYIERLKQALNNRMHLGNSFSSAMRADI